MVVCLRLSHSIRCIFLNITPRLEPVEPMCLPSDSGYRDDDGTQFIHFVDGRQLKVHEVWFFGEDGVTPEFHLKARIDVGDFVGT